MDVEIREWAFAALVALVCVFGWIPICWAIAKLGGWM